MEDKVVIKIQRVFKENSEIKLEDILRSIFEDDSKNTVDNFFRSLNIKDIDSIRKGDFTLC